MPMSPRCSLFLLLALRANLLHQSTIRRPKSSTLVHLSRESPAYGEYGRLARPGEAKHPLAIQGLGELRCGAGAERRQALRVRLGFFQRLQHVCVGDRAACQATSHLEQDNPDAETPCGEALLRSRAGCCSSATACTRRRAQCSIAWTSWTASLSGTPRAGQPSASRGVAHRPRRPRFCCAGDGGVLCVSTHQVVLDGQKLDLATVRKRLRAKWRELVARFEKEKKEDPDFAAPPDEDKLPKPEPVKIWQQARSNGTSTLPWLWLASAFSWPLLTSKKKTAEPGLCYA